MNAKYDRRETFFPGSKRITAAADTQAVNDWCADRLPVGDKGGSIIKEQTKMVIWHTAQVADEHRVNQKFSDDKRYRVYEEPQKGFYALQGSTYNA